MIISGFASAERQGQLFDQPLGNHGRVRNVIGDLAERTIEALLGGRRHKDDSQCDYCPDVSVMSPAGRVYVECKSVGQSNQAFIYSGRLEKDFLFAESRLLFYGILSHRMATKDYRYVSHIQREFFLHLDAFYLVPFLEIAKLCQKEENLNSNYGGTDRKIYGRGFRFPLKAVEDWRAVEWEESDENTILSLTKKSLKCSERESTLSTWKMGPSGMLRATKFRVLKNPMIPTCLFAFTKTSSEEGSE